MTDHLARYLSGAGLAVGVCVALGPALGAQPPALTAAPAAFFESQVRPVLVDRCFGCHGPEVPTPFGGLRMDSREALLEGGDSGPAIVPGRPDDSRLVQLLHGRPRLMPPNGALDEGEIASLVEWVAMGAPWGATQTGNAAPDPSAPFDLNERRATHWAWQPVRKIEPPVVDGFSDKGSAGASRFPHPVDKFIRATLATSGLTAARPVERRSLIRRASFDLRGLPPRPGEIAAFVASDDPDVYENLVDRYLASPRFGERWARHWMDLMRYSESHGSEGDPDTPLAWRYRDYLIRAFNGDVGYDQLVREHVAGDLLPNPRLNLAERLDESIIGTAHYRMVEHGYQPVDPWEDRVKWTDNQIDVVSKAFLGLTVSCARCHDHKFDAISQTDYYSLFGTLYGARPTQRAIDAPAWLNTHRDRLSAIKSDVKGQLAEAWRDQAAMVTLAPDEDVSEVGADDGGGGQNFVAVRDGSAVDAWLRLGEIPEAEFAQAWDRLQRDWREEITARTEFNGEMFTTAWDLTGPDYHVMVGHGTGFPDAPAAPGEFAIPPRGAQVLTGLYPAGAYTHLVSSKHNGVIQSPRFTIEQDHLSFRVLGSDLSFVQLIIENYAVPRGGIYHQRYSPKRDEMTWATWDTTFWKGFTAYVEFATRDDATRFGYDPSDSLLRPRPGRREDGRSSIGASHVVFHDTKATPRETVLPILYLLADDNLAAVASPESRADLTARVRTRLVAAIDAWRDDRLTEQQRAFLDEFVRRDLLPRTLADLPQLRSLLLEYRTLEAEVPVARRAPGVIEEGAPDQPLLIRGNHRRRGDVVPRRFLRAIDDRIYAEPHLVRLRLADAMTSPDNPLLARVAVNRIWRHLFGFGLVRSVDNFGRLGDKPSHPELLDYLAGRFVEDEYSVKRMVKLLMTSQTYRLSTEASLAAVEIDPSNRWLQHAHLRRLDAEAIRDAMLSVSGRLDLEMFGPSVHVYYPRGKGRTENTQQRGPIDGEGRRSVYQEIRRNVHNAFLEVFDLPKPASTRGQRDTTNVPAQSLTLLNSPFVIGQAAVWGERLAEGEAHSPTGRIDHMFLKALGREPSEAERLRTMEYVMARAGERDTPDHVVLYDPSIWQDVAHSLFNLKEFVFVQ
jgi:hypothetical protein